jgi:GNAT superfamily N-acetyltransferase
MDILTHLTIRPATRGDAPAIHDLHTASVTRVCATHYTPEQVRAWLANRAPEGYYKGIDHGEMFVCEAGGVVLGFGHAVPGEVVALYVHADWVRHGVGTALLSHGLQMACRGHAGPIRVVATLNAQSFYEKHGFREVRRSAMPRNGVEIPVVEMEREGERRNAGVSESAGERDSPVKRGERPG